MCVCCRKHALVIEYQAKTATNKAAPVTFRRHTCLGRIEGYVRGVESRGQRYLTPA